jgi:hypothetical protein
MRHWCPPDNNFVRNRRAARARREGRLATESLVFVEKLEFLPDRVMPPRCTTAKEFAARELRMTKSLSSIFIVVLIVIVTAMIVGTLLDFIPWDIRRFLGYVIVPVAVLWFLWSWLKGHAEQRGDQNQLDVLEETVQEHERGRHDNTEYIKKQIFFIERDHKRTPDVQRLLERARRAIQN